MRGLRLSRKQLIEEFGVGRRLAVRVGALLAKRVQITAAVIEMASPRSAMERLLTRPEILNAGTLTTETLTQLARETGAHDDGPFVVAEEGDWKTIALEEEQLAEEGFRDASGRGEPEPTGTALARPVETAAASGIFDHDASAELFTPEEVARLKLEALTSADRDARVSAMRRLQYAPISREEKGSIYLKVLLDPISPVRSEAVKALEGLGFDPDTAEAVQTMFEGDEHAREIAVQRIGALFDPLPAAQQQVVLAILAETLREAPSTDFIRHLLRVLTQAAAAIAAAPAQLRDLVRICFEKLVADLPQNGPVVRALFARVGALTPGHLADLVQHEIESLRTPAIRVFALTLLAQLDLDPPRKQAVVGLMADDLADMAASEIDLQKLGHNLAALGEVAAGPLLERFRAGTPAQKAFLSQFLDMVCVDHHADAAFRNRVVQEALACLRIADNRQRLALMRCRVLTAADLPAPLRKQVAEELIRSLHSYENPDILDRLTDALERLGVDAVEPLFHVIRDAPHGPRADRAVRVIAAVLGPASQEAWQRAGNVARIVAFARKLLDDPRTVLGGYAHALGAICANPAFSADQAGELMGALVSKMGKVPYPADLLEALGRLAASPHCPLPRKIELTRMFSTLMQHEDDEELVREIDTPDGKLYEFGARAEFDAEILPVVVAGLERICLAETTSQALREQLITEMLGIWEGVAAWRIIWGPRSTQALSSALGRIGSAADTPTATRVRIARMLQQQVGRMSVVRALPDLCSSEDDNPELNDLAVDVGLALIAQWIGPELADEERAIVLGSVARIAARPQLPPRNSRVRRLREHAADLLFDALRKGAAWSRASLELLRDCPNLPKNLHKQIADRLAQASAIVKSSGSKPPL